MKLTEGMKVRIPDPESRVPGPELTVTVGQLGGFYRDMFLYVDESGKQGWAYRSRAKALDAAQGATEGFIGGVEA